MEAEVWDDRPCELGEGPLWDPDRGRLYWFDILGKRLLWRDAEGPGELALPEMASAAGRAEGGGLVVATESRIVHLDPDSGEMRRLAELEADNPGTRSNDGRADPWGGFWCSTMGRKAEDGAGSIYRFHRGELRRLHEGITIPNAICFSPDRRWAHFSDTAQCRVWKQPLAETDGWPAGEAELFLDLSDEGLRPDGAVTDEAGVFWTALAGAGRVAAYSPEGQAPAIGQGGRGEVHLPGFWRARYADAVLHHLFREDGRGRAGARPRRRPFIRGQGVARGRPEPLVRL